MQTMYKSKIGDVRSKAQWVEWFNQGRECCDLPPASDAWERVCRILKLEKIDLDSWQSL